MLNIMLRNKLDIRMKSHKKDNRNKNIRVSKRGSAMQAVGTLQKNMDLFVLTYGQFSLIDALMAIIKQTGPAHVAVSTWTAAHAHLDRAAELMESANFLSFRMIVDRSFKTRQPKYFEHMISLFGIESIRAIRTHAKFMVIRNADWNIVVRTSMNLNENPRLENIEISESKEFAEFFNLIVDDIFSEVGEGVMLSDFPDLNSIEESQQFKMVSGDHINIAELNEAGYSHEITEH